MSVTKAEGVWQVASRCIRETPAYSLHCQQRTLFTRTTNHLPTCPFNVPRKRRRIQPSSCLHSISVQFNRAVLLNRPFTTTTTILAPRQDHQPHSQSTEGSPSKNTIPWPTHPNPTPYEIFHLPRNASLQDIKTQYFHLVKQYHPDHSSHSLSVDRFRKVVESYKILSNPTKRHEYDIQHPASTPIAPRHSEFRRPWSGSRLSRRKTEQKGPPGGWSFAHARKRSAVNPDFMQRDWLNTDVDNEHFSYEKHFRRNWEMEMKIKSRMDVLHARQAEDERREEMDRGTVRMGMAFTGGLFMLIMLTAKAMYPG